MVKFSVGHFRGLDYDYEHDYEHEHENSDFIFNIS